MIRNSVLGIVMLVFVAALAGCKKADGPRNDATVKSSPEIDPKTGKKAKSFEAGVMDPPGK